MMPTEHDIRDALNAKAAEAANWVPLPIGRPRSLRRVAPVLGAIAAVAVVAVTVSLVATGHKSTDKTAQPAAPRPPGPGCGAPATENTTLRFDFRVDGPDRFVFTPGTICSAMQQLEINNRDGIAPGVNPDLGTSTGSVSVFAPGAFDPTAAEQGQTATVHGRRGYFASLPQIVGTFTIRQQPQPSLAWEYAPNAWAVIQASWSQNPWADMQLIADQVQIGKHQPLRMPFKLGWVPAGFVVGGAHGLNVGLSDDTPAKSANCTTAGCGSAISIGVYPDHEPDGLHVPGAHRIKVDGHDAVLYPDASELRSAPTAGITYPPGLAVGFGDRTLSIQVDPNHVAKFSDQDLIKIAQNVTMSASMTDQSTWFDATTVVPH